MGQAVRRGLVVLGSLAALLGGVAPAADRAASLAPAHAQDSQLVDMIVEMLRSGNVGEVDQMISDERFLGAAKDHPGDLRRICAAALQGERVLVGLNAAKAKSIAETLLTAATACHEASPDAPDALWSLALARATRGRMERDSGGAPDAADWTESADLLEKAWGLAAENGAPAAQATELLLDAANLPGAPAADLRTRADGLLDSALTKHPDSGPLLRSYAARTMERAGAAGVKKTDAVGLVKAALDRIRPVAVKADPDVDAATAWNDLVSFETERKFGIKAELVARAAQDESKLEMQVPVSRWFLVGDGGSGSIVIDQRDAKSGARRARLTFQVYKWEIAYQFGGTTEAGGDNLKGIAAANLGSLRSQLYEKGAFKDVSKGRLNGHVDGGYLWESTGRAEKGGSETHVRAWYFKSGKGHQVTYEVQLEEWDGNEADFAMKSVLDSITELDRNK